MMFTNIFDCKYILRSLESKRLKYESKASLSNEDIDLNYISYISEVIENRPCSVPHVSYSIQNAWLDNIVQEILSRLKNECFKSSIFRTSSEKFIWKEQNFNINDNIWDEININHSIWNKSKTSQIIKILEEYIFSELMIYKLNELWTQLIQEHSVSYSKLIYCGLYKLNFVKRKVSAYIFLEYIKVVNYLK